jgi:hypothetical protein
MRKTEMSPIQREDRDHFASTLKSHDWMPSGSFNDKFEDGWWVPYQAVMEFKGENVNLVTNYIAGHGGQVLVRYSTKKYAPTLSFRFEHNSKDIVEYLIESKNNLSQKNLKAHFLDLIRRFPSRVSISVNDDFESLDADVIERVL